MARETVIGSYLLRLLREDGVPRIQVRDLRRNDVIEFETWVGAWEYLDRLMRDVTPEPYGPRSPR